MAEHDWQKCPLAAVLDERIKTVQQADRWLRRTMKNGVKVSEQRNGAQEKRIGELATTVAELTKFLGDGLGKKIEKTVRELINAAIVKFLLWFVGALLINVGLTLLVFCGEGQGGRLIDEGLTYREGDLPVNASGGCIGHAHAGGAAGLMSLVEVVRQLRCECGPYQVKPIPKVGLSESMGGSAMSIANVAFFEVEIFLVYMTANVL